MKIITYLLSLKGVAILLTIFGIIISYFFFSNLSKEYTWGTTPILMAETGQVGDFIGGIVGTVFSFVGVLLLFQTLSLQRQELNSSNNVFEHQQFDNTFFELLNLHKENVKKFITYDVLGNVKKGQDFFIHQKEFLQDTFIPCKNLSRNRKNAVELFNIVYANNEESFSIYFRTLYQIYSLIEDSKISGKLQASYSKILRAQLSGAELFFIRYNAMTENGYKSSRYINIFNITKHLSHFELLEFKYWWSQLTVFERNGLATIIKSIKSILKIFLVDEEVHTIKRDWKNKKYTFIMESDKKSEFSLEILIDNTKNTIQQSAIDGLVHFFIE